MARTIRMNVSFSTKLVLSDEGMAEVLAYTANRNNSNRPKAWLDAFYANATDEEKVAFIYKEALIAMLKQPLRDLHDNTKDVDQGDSFTYGPIRVQNNTGEIK